MNLIDRYFKVFQEHSTNIAFCHGEKSYTYLDFLENVNAGRLLLESYPGNKPKSAVGIFCDEQMETYTAVFSIWFAGCYIVPLQKNAPKKVNQDIIKKHHIKFIFSTEENEFGSGFKNVDFINNFGLRNSKIKAPFKWTEDQILYVLNTSGSTGTPKNVPINIKNVEAFIEGFMKLYPELNASDNFLQTYELTADAAFTGYLIPLLIGASVYTLQSNLFKPFAVAKVLNKKPITWTQVTPSLLACLQPFFDSFHNETIKHFHFGGEALPLSLVEKWRECVPNAEISNVYGPTETTITSSIYKCLPSQKLKAFRNIVSIGKPLQHVNFLIQTKDSNKNNNGELHIAGEHVMKGYLFTDSQPFINLETEKGQQKFYPTGDIVHKDENGNYHFLERKDNQVKINGFRVDLIEIENTIRECIAGTANIVVVPAEESPGLKKLFAFVEKLDESEEMILKALNQRLPDFKIPERIISVPFFPLTSSGKTNIKELIAKYYKQSE